MKPWSIKPWMLQAGSGSCGESSPPTGAADYGCSFKPRGSFCSLSGEPIDRVASPPQLPPFPTSCATQMQGGDDWALRATAVRCHFEAHGDAAECRRLMKLHAPEYYALRPSRCHEYARTWATAFLERGSVHHAPPPPPQPVVPDEVACDCAWRMADRAYASMREAATHDALISSVLECYGVSEHHLLQRMHAVAPMLCKDKGVEFKMPLSAEVMEDRRQRCLMYLRMLHNWRREGRDLFKCMCFLDGKTIYIVPPAAPVWGLRGRPPSHPWSPLVVHDPHLGLREPLKMSIYICVGPSGPVLLDFVTGTSQLETGYKVCGEGGWEGQGGGGGVGALQGGGGRLALCGGQQRAAVVTKVSFTHSDTAPLSHA